MRHAPVAIVAAGMLVWAAAASAAAPTGFYESFKLEPAATFVAGKPVKVWCASSQYDWTQFLRTSGHEGATAYGSTVPGSSDVKLAPTVCQSLKERLAKKVVTVAYLGPSILVLTHEAIHARGEIDEGTTDCDAIHEMPRVAVRYFSVRAGKQLRAVMTATWAYRSRETAPYRSVC